MTETEFHTHVDALLNSVESQLDEVAADIDCELSSGILTLSFADGTKLIVNRQTPNREIWVAAKAGGYHFRLAGDAWTDTRSGESLDACLTRAISAQSGTDIRVSIGRR